MRPDVFWRYAVIVWVEFLTCCQFFCLWLLWTRHIVFWVMCCSVYSYYAMEFMEFAHSCESRPLNCFYHFIFASWMRVKIELTLFYTLFVLIVYHAYVIFTHMSLLQFTSVRFNFLSFLFIYFFPGGWQFLKGFLSPSRITDAQGCHPLGLSP